MCETRDLGIKWPHWYSLLFEGQVAVDMRVVCPQDVKHVPKRGRMVYWKRWAALHESEELNEAVWLEPIEAMLRITTNEVWTDRHANVTRKLVVERGWLQKRLYDIGSSDEKKCRGFNKAGGTGEAQIVSLTLPVLEGSQKPDPKRLGEMGAKDQDIKEILVVAKSDYVVLF